MTPEAPEGFIAIPAAALCGGCAFWKKCRKNNEPEDIKCCPSERKDGKLVIFKRK